MKSIINTKDTAHYLALLLEADIPYQFVPYTGLSVINKLCQKFDLPAPKLIGGNIVFGNLSSCDFLLSAHLDETAFGIKKITNNGAWLAPYHKYIPVKEERQVSILGIRNNTVVQLGKGKLINEKEGPYCQTKAKLLLGDRMVYRFETQIVDNLVTGKAIDDRVGVLITLLALRELKGKNISVVLSDGETGIPEGYFARNFPHVLRYLKKNCTICFVDGLYRNDLEPLGYNKAPKNILIPHHSSFGKGLVVSPVMFSWLRDEAIPDAKKCGIEVELCEAYRSRGDEWGMITNPVSGNDFAAIIVDWGAWGGAAQEVPLTVDVDCVKNAVSFIKKIISSKKYE